MPNNFNLMNKFVNTPDSIWSPKEIFDFCFHVANYSPDHRKKVGVVIADINLKVYSFGFNSKPFNSNSFSECIDSKTNKSCQDLLHAEEMAILKLGSLNCKNKIAFSTSCPCIRCSGKIAFGQISKVFYLEDHDNNEGHDLLENDYNIKCFNVKNHYQTKSLERFNNTIIELINN